MSDPIGFRRQTWLEDTRLNFQKKESYAEKVPDIYIGIPLSVT